MNYNPLIGVFSTVKINPDTGFPVGKEARTFKEKFAAAKKYGLTMFLFLADDVSLMNRTINGYVFTTGNDNKSYWERKVFPFPDIVYNRIRFRKVEKQSDVRQLLKTFADDPHIKLFNSRFLDKWEVHQALIKNLTTQDMVPPTYLLSIPNLRTLLAKYTRVFIKPRNNNAGRGIIKVICDSPSMYTYSHSDASPPKWTTCTSFTSLWKHLLNIVHNPDDYLVQTGIDLCRLNGQVFDLRAQVQKDGQGLWVFTGINVRVATENRFVTYPKMGKKISFDQVIDIIANGSLAYKNFIYDQLSDFYRYVPRVLEEELHLSLGVLSMDIGIDIQGRVWLIEVSSKSDSFGDDKIRARHFKYLMEYFLYITKENVPGRQGKTKPMRKG